VKRPSKPQCPIPNPQPAVPAARLLHGILLFFLTLAVALRPLLPGHRAEANLWVEMCVFVAAMAWLIRMAIAGRLRLARTGVGLPALTLLALATLSTLRSPHPAKSLATLLEWLSYAGVLVALVNLTAEGGADRRFFLRLLWASAFAACLYGLFQQFVNLPLLQGQIQADSERVLAELRMSSRHIGELMARATGRIFSTFLLSNSFAGFLALVTPGFVGYALDRLGAGERRGAFVVASALWLVAALACLLLTYSKGGWVAFAVGGAAFCLMLGKDLLRRHARLVAAVVVGGVALFGLLLAVRVVPVQIFRDALPSLDVRAGYWRASLDMARDHPLGGVGLGAWGTHYPRYRPLLAHPAQDAHNDYLQVLAELGVPGLAAFLWLWAACLRSASSPSPDPRPPTPCPQHRSCPPFPRGMAYAAAVVAFILTTIAMATFSLAGWWDNDPEAKAWLDRLLTAGLLGAWALFFAALGRGEAAPPGVLCRKGLLCGLVAFLVHCAVDFDYQEPGVAFSAWVVAALAVRPRGEARELRLAPAAAIALAVAAVVAMAAFQFLLVRATGAATDRDVASLLLSDAMRALSAQRRAELLADARQRYERALRGNPLDDSLRMEYADLLVSLLVPPDPSGRTRAEARAAASPELRLRLETPDDAALFRRAAELYERAGELNRAWAAPHIRIGGILFAAAHPDAGPAASRILLPIAERYAARRAPTGPNLPYLPAVAEFEAALACDPNNPSVLLMVAEARAKHGDPAAAAPARRALDIDAALRAADPGHKLCLKDDEVARARALAERTTPAGAKP